MTHHEASGKSGGASGGPCRVCSHAAPDGEEHAAGICRSCWYKILVVILIVMIAASYAAWFGVF